MKYRPVRQHRQLRPRWDHGLASSPPFPVTPQSVSLALRSTFSDYLPFFFLSCRESSCLLLVFHACFLDSSSTLSPPSVFLTNVDFGGAFPVWRFQFVDRKEEERNSFEPRRATVGAGVNATGSIPRPYIRPLFISFSFLFVPLTDYPFQIMLLSSSQLPLVFTLIFVYLHYLRLFSLSLFPSFWIAREMENRLLRGCHGSTKL